MIYTLRNFIVYLMRLGTVCGNLGVEFRASCVVLRFHYILAPPRRTLMDRQTVVSEMVSPFLSPTPHHPDPAVPHATTCAFCVGRVYITRIRDVHALHAPHTIHTIHPLVVLCRHAGCRHERHLLGSLEGSLLASLPAALLVLIARTKPTDPNIRWKTNY